MLQQVPRIFKQANSFVSLGKRYTVSFDGFVNMQSNTGVMLHTVAEQSSGNKSCADLHTLREIRLCLYFAALEGSFMSYSTRPAMVMLHPNAEITRT